MLKLVREMPRFLKYNELLIKRNLYLEKTGSKNVCTYYAPAYLTTTENINGYYNHMDFKNKSVLTVIGASDHIFNAVLRGAKSVDGFDISIYAIMFYYLKEAALKALDYEEFITFLYDYKNFFNKKTYQKIIPYMNETAIPFWNLVFSTKNPTEIIKSSHFSWRSFISADCKVTINMLKKISSYLDKDNFYVLKEKIKNCPIRIFLREVRELDDIDGNYDYIILSNIIDYVEFNEFERAIERYISKLNILGEIKVGYIYNSPYRYSNKYEVEAIDSFAGAITGESEKPNYVLTKKREI